MMICVLKFLAVLGFILAISCRSWCMAEGDDDKPLWEYGVGLGYFEYEHYPASNNFSWMLLPFPTFQYRGETLRADDREGTRAYLLKESHWSFDFTGNVWPGQSWANDAIRQGMPTLPWIFALGPQLVYDWSKNWQFRLAALQALATDFAVLETSGGYFDARGIYKWADQVPWAENSSSMANVSLSLQAGTKDFLATYFEVSPQQATAARPAYQAVGGLLSYEISFFQAFRRGRAEVYVGGSLNNYDISVNRQSPLHQSDHNFTYFVGLTYTLGESKAREYKKPETEGVINRYYEKMK